MAFSIDPRDNLPSALVQPTQAARAEATREHNRRSIAAATAAAKSRPQRRACHDWIFCSASNAHVAIDRSSFKTYTAFKSYVLTLSDQREVSVRGIGIVELSIRRQPGSKEAHTIILENVLHVPSWMCNVFSDIYFWPVTAFQHTWTDLGVSFMKRNDEGKLRYWGFTEDFCGLERLVLAKEIGGRSPMLEDKDREVYSVNVSWPQGQRDRWNDAIAAGYKDRKMKEEVLKEIYGNGGCASLEFDKETKLAESQPS